MIEEAKQRRQWTPEHRAAVKAAKECRRAENIAQYGTVTSPESRKQLNASRAKNAAERKNTSKACAYLPELQHWVLSLLQAMNDSEVYTALLKAYPERRIQWDFHHQHILFSFKTNSLRFRYGILAEQMFRRLFCCYQPGGFSKKTGSGFCSVWRLNQEALSAWLIQSQSQKNFSVAAAFKVLMNFPEVRRQASEYDLVRNEFGYYELKGKRKTMMEPEERMAALAIRKEMRVELEEKNRVLLEDWVVHRTATALHHDQGKIEP